MPPRVEGVKHTSFYIRSELILPPRSSYNC